ncbi:ABC transporter ATP-binding protein [Nitratireductor sp. GISD-1A_MAKvit]|uniref:ABC transporter ATP-binding protein n=1 Tax=Nitratireductor sp. GISD-1A_MAKvit TaxID=3234198 RepID=UPI003466C295
MSSDIILDVQNISKTFKMYNRPWDRLLERIPPFRTRHKAFKALAGIDLQVRRGETVGIIGRNGSGKSTLLQLVCGTLTPSSGTIGVNGRIAALLELGAGFNPEFTGRENVYLNAAILGLERKQIEERMPEILAFADIGDFVDQPVKTYSSGMYVRLAFAVIAHVEADILVIDEALAVGDALFTQKCMRFLRKFQETGTILFVSHDSAAVTNLCERAVWLHEGEIAAQGDAKSVSEAYLASLFETVATSHRSEANRPNVPKADEWVDRRQAFINCTNLRNDIEVFRFEAANADFGSRGASIVDVYLADDDGRRMSYIVGGEICNLHVDIVAHQDLARPIVGFFVKDRLGQQLFGDNSYLTYLDSPRSVLAGGTLSAVFRFPMPLLPVGDYSIAVAVADGTQEDHVQHHWIHDAVIFRSHCSAAAAGLVGIPMLDVKLDTSAPSTVQTSSA